MNDFPDDSWAYPRFDQFGRQMYPYGHSQQPGTAQENTDISSGSSWDSFQSGLVANSPYGPTASVQFDQNALALIDLSLPTTIDNADHLGSASRLACNEHLGPAVFHHTGELDVDQNARNSFPGATNGATRQYDDWLSQGNNMWGMQARSGLVPNYGPAGSGTKLSGQVTQDQLCPQSFQVSHLATNTPSYAVNTGSKPIWSGHELRLTSRPGTHPLVSQQQQCLQQSYQQQSYQQQSYQQQSYQQQSYQQQQYQQYQQPNYANMSNLQPEISNLACSSTDDMCFPQHIGLESELPFSIPDTTNLRSVGSAFDDNTISVPEDNPATSRRTFDDDVDDGMLNRSNNGAGEDNSYFIQQSTEPTETLPVLGSSDSLLPSQVVQGEFEYRVRECTPQQTSNDLVTIQNGEPSASFYARLGSLSVPRPNHAVPTYSPSGSSPSSSPWSPATSSLSDVLYCDHQDCKATFGGVYRKGNFSRHKRLFHGDSEGYPCAAPQCDRSFKRSDARLKHYRVHHPKLAPKPIESRRMQRKAKRKFA